MTKSKRIKELENRILSLERELNTLISAISAQNDRKKEEKSYEEVIYEWLCGKTR